MLSPDTSIIGLLNGVRVELTSADAGNALSLARPRAMLAWIASLLPPESEEPRRVLDMVAQLGAEIGLGGERDPRDAARLNVAVQAVTAVTDFLANPQSSDGTPAMAEAEATLAAVSSRLRAAPPAPGLRQGRSSRSASAVKSARPHKGVQR